LGKLTQAAIKALAGCMWPTGCMLCGLGLSIAFKLIAFTQIDQPHSQRIWKIVMGLGKTMTSSLT